MTMSIRLLKTNFRKAFLLNMVSFDNRMSVSKKPDEEARIPVTKHYYTHLFNYTLDYLEKYNSSSKDFRHSSGFMA